MVEKGNIPWNKGKKGSQVAWNKGLKGVQVAWNKGIPFSEVTRKKMSEAKKGKKQRVLFTQERRDAIRARRLGKKHTPEAKLKMSINRKGKMTKENHFAYGKEKPIETKEKLSRTRKERCLAVGKNNPAWKGGISFLPYCEKFNNEFKNRVRAFFNYQCVECGTPQNGTGLPVHHVNYDKMMCCNDVKPLFVTLCFSCNARANKDREYWQKHFTEIIEGYYQGKCYFDKDEMKAHQS